jgi:mono/diheme cytochrome c family protein
MKPIARTGLAVAGTLCAVAVGALLFVTSGLYNIGADDHHTLLVMTLIERLRERSISVRLNEVSVPPLEQPAQIVAGADLYSTHCVGCHLAPGVMTSDLRPGLYPHPPNLVMAPDNDPRRLFWVIKHGIKMSAMPAWGKSLSDPEIWEIVAFVQKMPALSQDAYLQLLNDRTAR